MISDEVLLQLYPRKELDAQRRRYNELEETCAEEFGRRPERFFSSPGRTELGGNHTDHNRGRVVAASIQLDKAAAVVPENGSRVRMVTSGFDEKVDIDLEHLEPVDGERGSSAGIVRGIAAYLKQRGYRIGGWSAYVQSNVAMGSGLSSSASIEVLIAEIFNSLYNEGKMGAVEKALAGQWAENNYFGKPCGLMDQLACAHGGIIAIDFENPTSPMLTPVDSFFSDHGYSLCILDTGSSHADLTDDYASIPMEMGCIAHFFGAETLREIEAEKVYAQAKELRDRCGDRALLRALHFYGEHERAGEMVRALQAADAERYLELVRASASSSWRLLQNCIPTAGAEQGLALSLALSEEILAGRGAARVHGGGFAGTAQIYVPKEELAGYRERIEQVFGEGTLRELKIRPKGVVAL